MIETTRRAPVIFLLISMMVTASDRNNSSAYSDQLKLFYDQEPPRCLGEYVWPVLIPSHQSSWEKARLLALKDAGLAEINYDGKNRYFNLTPVGQKNFDRYGDLCYGNIRLNKIQKIDSTNPGMTNVLFTIKLTNREKWATNINLRAAFSELDLLISGTDSMIYRATFINQAGKVPVLQDTPEPEGLDY